MAATATDLTIDATVSTELGISAGGTVVPRLILVASAAVRAYLNRPAMHYSTGIVEYVAGFGRPRIILSRRPLGTITSIEVDGDAVDADEYEIEDADAGIVYRENGWDWTALRRRGLIYEPVPGTETRPIEVTYSGGWVTPGQEALAASPARTLPYDIEQATIETCVALYRRRGSDGGIVGESLGAASVTYGGLNTAIGRGLGGVIPDSAIPLLQPWRLVL